MYVQNAHETSFIQVRRQTVTACQTSHKIPLSPAGLIYLLVQSSLSVPLFGQLEVNMASVTQSLVQTVTRTVTTTSPTATSGDRAPPQGGVFEGVDPTHFDPKNPITLFVIQAVLVIAFTRILHWPLSKLRQPRVIAEVITVGREHVCAKVIS